MSDSPATLETETKGGTQPLWQFSLGELMVFITLLAICFSLWPIDPVLSVFLLMLISPATLRTVAAKRVAQQAGRNLTGFQQVFEFLYSGLLVFIGFFVFEIVFTAIAFVLVALLVMSGRWIYPLITQQVFEALLIPFYGFLCLLFVYVEFRFLKKNWPR